jgi:hypothetical protein
MTLTETKTAETFIVLDPTLEVETPHVERAARQAGMQEIHTLGLLDNGKRNSDKLLKQVGEKVAAQQPGMKINYYRKPGAYRPAPNALLDQVAAECDAVLVGIGD